MKIEEYFNKFPLCKRPETKKDKTFGNYSFVSEIFFPMGGEDGLDKLENEFNFIDAENNRRRIDFVLHGKNAQYAIEVDDATHYQASHEKYSDDQLKKNSINEYFKGQYRTIPLHDILHNKTRAIDTLLRFFIAEPEFNVNSKTFTSGKPKPNEVQNLTLDKLNKFRKEGKTKGLVCYATGLGKTYLSAFDAKNFGGKTLFIVHRDEILKKSQKSFKAVWPEKSSGFFNAEEKNTKADIIFASIQTLYRHENLSLFNKKHFDYIIVDETHHSSDENITYSNVLNYFEPKFLLGLTATPERSDDFDIIKNIYDGNLIHEIRTEEAIEKGYLVPYEWYRFKDNVDYSNIRWNNRKYYEEDLNQLLVIEPRDKLIIKKFKSIEKPIPQRTLAFCVNIQHAHRFAEELKKNKINAAAIHSNTNSSSEFFLSKEQRLKNTQDFINGKIEVACVVDIFNEGIDIEQIDCLLLLRPTHSSTIAIQQFGRGLRLSNNKFKLRVLDFIGSKQRNTLGVFEGVTGTIDIPEKDLFYYDNNGNKIFFDKEVIDIFRQEEALYSPKIKKDKIPEKWKKWGEYLVRQAKSNMYAKIGQHEKNIITQLEGCRIYKNNPTINADNFNKKLSKISNDTSGTRTMILSRYLGLIDKDNRNKPTKVYDEIVKRTNNFKEIEKYIDLIETQLEKYCYWNRVARGKDIRNPNSEAFNKNFKNFLIITLYKVLLKIGEKNNNYEISYDEYKFFVFISRNYNEYKDIVEHILSLRNEPQKLLISRYLNDLISNKPKLDDRFYQIFNLIPSLIYNHDKSYIRINERYLDRIKLVINSYEDKLVNNKIPFPLENGERGKYEDVLFNPEPLWK